MAVHSRQRATAVDWLVMRRLRLSVALVFLAAACGSSDRYELVATSSPAMVYRVDRHTGEVVLVNAWAKEGTYKGERVLAPGPCRRVSPDEPLGEYAEKWLPGSPRPCDDSW